ncbi:MAG: VOC family protein [Pyrinomonadaceae bacterium]
MASFNPYLNFPGTTEEAFNFYKSVFGGEFLAVMRFKDSPGCDGMPLQEGDKDKIMHIALPLGGGTVLMATDALESMGQKLNIGDNFSICINPDSKEDADRLYQALSEGGKQSMPIQDMFWGAYWGMLTDKFGVQWMLNYDPAHAGA